VWVPFSVTLTVPVVAGSASVSFPLQCLPSMVGTVYETQWTTVDLTQAPCSLVAGFVLSERQRMTIGQ
jgi:hypothetical protein